MPSAHTLHYATPLCFARRMLRRGQHGWHFHCYQPLRYDMAANLWWCVACGSSIAGALVAARRVSTALEGGSVGGDGVHPAADSRLDRTGG
jgi:hypothetical protein